MGGSSTASGRFADRLRDLCARQGVDAYVVPDAYTGRLSLLVPDGPVYALPEVAEADVGVEGDRVEEMGVGPWLEARAEKRKALTAGEALIEGNRGFSSTICTSWHRAVYLAAGVALGAAEPVGRKLLNMGRAHEWYPMHGEASEIRRVTPDRRLQLTLAYDRDYFGRAAFDPWVLRGRDARLIVVLGDLSEESRRELRSAELRGAVTVLAGSRPEPVLAGVHDSASWPDVAALMEAMARRADASEG